MQLISALHPRLWIQQAGYYYAALAAADQSGHSNPFVGFLLSSRQQALREASPTDPVSDQVKALLKCLSGGPLSTAACMKKLGLSHRPTFRRNYLQPALASSRIQRTLPDKRNSRLQKYRRIL